MRAEERVVKQISHRLNFCSGRDELLLARDPKNPGIATKARKERQKNEPQINVDCDHPRTTQATVRSDHFQGSNDPLAVKWPPGPKP
jgi:hypothetical protein